ncbi:PAS domain-containing protein [Vibrio lentus]|uniref:PAS domain-containing protein n=1 Tax=Vibrio lentus TaxID=136468 RepID=UPI001055EF70|nr:PAS domain S-box protein [Vibrio lentus]
MFFIKNKKKVESLPDENLELVDSLYQSLAVIEFDLNGTILKASAPFLEFVGYSIEEIQGKHHSIFCSDYFVRTPEYAQFWSDLSLGKKKGGVFTRLTKAKDEVFIEATYFPIFSNGTVVKVVKVASDVTYNHRLSLANNELLSALNSTFAVISFLPSGDIIEANKQFLNTLGYSESQVKAQHHKMFCFDDFYQENPFFGKSYNLVNRLAVAF